MVETGEAEVETSTKFQLTSKARAAIKHLPRITPELKARKFKPYGDAGHFREDHETAAARVGEFLKRDLESTIKEVVNDVLGEAMEFFPLLTEEGGEETINTEALRKAIAAGNWGTFLTIARMDRQRKSGVIKTIDRQYSDPLNPESVGQAPPATQEEYRRAKSIIGRIRRITGDLDEYFGIKPISPNDPRFLKASATPLKLVEEWRQRVEAQQKEDKENLPKKTLQEQITAFQPGGEWVDFKMRGESESSGSCRIRISSPELPQ